MKKILLIFLLLFSSAVFADNNLYYTSEPNTFECKRAWVSKSAFISCIEDNSYMAGGYEITRKVLKFYLEAGGVGSVKYQKYEWGNPTSTAYINFQYRAKPNYCDTAQAGIDENNKYQQCVDNTPEGYIVDEENTIYQCNAETEQIEGECNYIPDPDAQDFCELDSTIEQMQNDYQQCIDNTPVGQVVDKNIVQCTNGVLQTPVCTYKDIDDGDGDGDGGGDGGTDGGGGTDENTDLSGVIGAIETNTQETVNNSELLQAQLDDIFEFNKLTSAEMIALDTKRNDDLLDVTSTLELGNSKQDELIQLGADQLAHVEKYGSELDQILNDMFNQDKNNTDDIVMAINNAPDLSLDPVVDELAQNSTDLLNKLDENSDESNDILVEQTDKLTDALIAQNELLMQKIEDLLSANVSSAEGTQEIIDDGFLNMQNYLGDSITAHLCALRPDLCRPEPDEEGEEEDNGLGVDVGFMEDHTKSTSEMLDKNLNTFSDAAGEQLDGVLDDSPMTDQMFSKVEELYSSIIPVSSECQNVSFGDYFTIDCEKFKKFRDILGWMIFVYTILQLIEILFTGIAAPYTRK